MNEEGIKVSARPILVLTCFYFLTANRVMKDLKNIVPLNGKIISLSPRNNVEK